MGHNLRRTLYLSGLLSSLVMLFSSCDGRLRSPNSTESQSTLTAATDNMCTVDASNSASTLPHPKVNFSRVSTAEIRLELGREIEVLDPATVQANGAFKGAMDTQAFQFRDGRIVVEGAQWEPDGSGQILPKGDATLGLWSKDGGASWTAGIVGPNSGGFKTAIEWAPGKILNLHRTAQTSTNGFYLVAQRSDDNWAQIPPPFNATLDTPLADKTGGDDGTFEPGLLMHHGIIALKTGDLMASMYGNYRGDKTMADGHPETLGFRKYRSVVVFSSDEGRTWGRPITAAYDRMLVRGASADAQTKELLDAPAVTQEGFGESDLVRSYNGDILLLMRTGARLSKWPAPVHPTPLYLARSCDEGRTWSHPVQIAPFGSHPYAIALSNGILVASFSRPGGWVSFSNDNGLSWRGNLKLSESDSNINILPLSSDRFLALYFGRDRKVFAREIRASSDETPITKGWSASSCE